MTVFKQNDKHKQNRLKKLSGIAFSLTLIAGIIACQSDEKDKYVYLSDSDDSFTFEKGDCNTQTDAVNWNALMTENCPNLSDYNLFAESSDPTKNPNDGGMIYDLTTPLFTDYATKYRFIFVPEGEQIEYNENEILNMPVGTVLTKTFTMPTDTSMRDGNEYVIETRLLIHRPDGWVARPYLWDGADAQDANLQIASAKVPVSTTHNGEVKSFDYIVPSQASCLACHALQSTNSAKVFMPIGPKARLLNRDFSYSPEDAAGLGESVTMNQLSFMAERGILTGLPSSEQVPSTPSFKDGDEANLENLTEGEVEDLAKAYLDINCAHCHRAELSIDEIKLNDGSNLDLSYRGAAGSTGLLLEYNRAYSADASAFGACKTPVAGGHVDYPYDVVPGRADLSYLAFRIETTEPRHKMPELGRVTTHDEGVALINTWINQLAPAACSE